MTHAQLEDLKLKKASTFYKVKDAFKSETKDVDMTKRIVKSVPNTYNFYDSDGDVLLPGCAIKTISEKGPDSTGFAKIKNVKDHVITQRIGKPTVLDERQIDGVDVMYGESKMLSTTLGDDMLIEYQEGVIDQHSIGFMYGNLDLVTADDATWKMWMGRIMNPEKAEEAGYVFLVKEINMFEWSPVSFGANSLSPYLGVKADNKEGQLMKINNRLDLLEKQLRSGKQSDFAMLDYELETRQLKQIIGELFNQEPSIKDTLIERRLKEDTIEKGTGQTGCPSCFKTFNYDTSQTHVKCPSCGIFVSPGEIITSLNFDLTKAINETIFFK